MKLFLKYILIFVTPLIILAVLFEISLREIPNDYSYKSNYLNKNAAKIKILVLGSSHAYYGIDPEYISPQSFNAAYVSQTLDYDFSILKKYVDKCDSLRYIILPIDYFSLYGKLKTGAESWRVKNYVIYYGINNLDNNVGQLIKNHSELLSNSFDVNRQRFSDFYIKKIKNIISSKSGWGTNNNSKNKKDLAISGKEAAKRHLATDNKYFNENVENLKSIIELSKARKVQVILYTSPAYKSYVQNIDTNQFIRTINVATKVAASYPNVNYFNLFTDKRFTENDFYDADHLNEIGAKKLSLEIDSLIKTIKPIN